ncbi:MAG TPA: type II secretion system protein N [Sphingomicrobium sp.]|nr:type II secretion system protein N [Sphingomicrobium sp.]
MKRLWLTSVLRLEPAMRRRWLAWTLGIFGLALVALFPLRVALGLSDLERIGFTARQVAGTIWYGRVGELHLRSQPLGTFEVQLDPLALLIGRISMSFDRTDDPQGLLEGRLVAGLRRGVKDASGRIAAGAMFAPLPIEALEVDDLTVLFRNGRCVESSGRVTPVMAAPVPGVQFAGLTGTMQCDGERARVEMQSASGAERVDFYVHSSGRYRGWLSVRSTAPEVGAALSVLGFRPSPQGMTLTVNGRL